MPWSELDYNWVVKTHYVYHSVLDITKRDIELRHRCLPIVEKDKPEFKLDPGGMIFMNNLPMKHTLPDGSIISVKPELIVSALHVWSKHRVLDERLPDGEKVIKVYCGPYFIMVMPESIYNEIGAWLALNKSVGYVANMELIEAMSGSPHVLIVSPPSEGEA